MFVIDGRKVGDQIRNFTSFHWGESSVIDYIIIEFDRGIDMEEYLFKIEHLNVFAKFYVSIILMRWIK